MDNQDSSDELIDNLLDEEEEKDWIIDYNKKKCPECKSLHEPDASKCSVCGWSP